jgi:branched-chain amino acid transport system permease protein
MTICRGRRQLGLSSTDCLGAALALVPLLLVPYAFKPYAANALALFLIYGLLAMSLNLIWGYAGIISFGQTAFFGIGAYAYGVIALNSIGSIGTTGLALLGGIGTASVLAFASAYFVFYGRLSDVYAAIIMLVLSLVLNTLMVSTAGEEWVIGVARLGGFNGLFGQGSAGQNIGNFQIPPITLEVPGMSRPLAFEIDRTSFAGYYLVLGACLLSYVATRLLLATRLGRVCVAIREDERRAAHLGYDIRLYKLVIFTVAGAVAGLAGVLFAGWGRFVSPDVFGLGFASGVVVNVLLGGRLSLIGGFVGAVAVNYLTSYLGALTPPSSSGGTGISEVVYGLFGRAIEQSALLVQGAVLIITVLLLKEGITPPLTRFLKRRSVIGWAIVLPLLVAYFAAQVACRQADVCFY